MHGYATSQSSTLCPRPVPAIVPLVVARAERRALLAWRTPERNAPGPLVEFTPRQGDAIDRGDEETRLADFPFFPSGLVRGKTLLGIQRSPTLFPTTLSTQVVTNIIRLYRMQPSFYRVPSSQSPFSFLIDPKRISECRVDEKSSIQNRWKGI